MSDLSGAELSLIGKGRGREKHCYCTKIYILAINYRKNLLKFKLRTARKIKGG